MSDVRDGRGEAAGPEYDPVADTRRMISRFEALLRLRPDDEDVASDLAQLRRRERALLAASNMAPDDRSVVHASRAS
jgi:hypothetical protein